MVCWQEDGAWLGYWKEYPAYWSASLQDLREHLDDLLRDIRSGEIPGVA